MGLSAHSAAWYDRLATLQEGYAYPWRSRLTPWHGEDAYLELVRQHLRPTADVLDIACGHGEVALAVAPHVRSVRAYDRVLTNVTVLHHDSSSTANGVRARLPAADASCDLLLCSKGPFHWIDDARRVARRGATLLMLVPDATPLTPWHGRLPEKLRWVATEDPHWARPAIEGRLAAIGLALHSWWSFEVPEVFPDPEQLYTWLAWGRTPEEVPAFDAARPTLDAIFAAHAGPEGLAIRYRRYLWKAEVPS